MYILLQMSIEALEISSSYWMAWGSSSSGHVSANMLIWVYPLVGAAATVFVLLATITTSIIGYKAAHKYFSLMLRSIFCAPMSFFDSTPSGRITSRQGKGGKVDVPLRFQKHRMQSLPRLLWELKHTHVPVSQAVL